MPKERVIDLQLIKPITSGSPSSKGKISLKNLFKEELTKLNVAFSDPCCPSDEPPISLFIANNGLSQDGLAYVFGQDLNDATNPAVLLANREVPQAGFSIFYTGVGNTIIGRNTSDGSKLQVQGSVGVNQSLLSLKLSAAYTNATPITVTRNSADLVIMETRNPVNGGFTSTFLGKGAGALCTANTNVGIGENCLPILTSGTSNIAIGFNTLAFLTTGISNVAVGHASQNLMATGSRNISMGRTSLLRATVGNGNIVFGDSAMQETANAGIGNVVIGFTAFGAGSGDNNIAIGSGAMFYQNAVGGTTRPTTQNIAIGYRASFTVQLGTNNTVLGTQANVAGILGDNNIIIGANSDSTATITNTTLIGTTITTALSNIVALGRADQNTIVGVTNPTTNNGARLQVNGDITTSAPVVGAIGKWKLGQFDNNAAVTTARVKINVDSIDYWIPVQVA